MPSVCCGSPSASPATTLVTLALCIGATTAIFSSVYSLMLKPLPYQEPERIVELYSSAVKAGLNRMPANVPFYLDYSTERDLLREPRAVDVLLRPGRRKGFRRPHARRPGDRRDLQHPADPARARQLLHEGEQQAGQRQGHRPHAVLLADAVSGESGGHRQGSADRRRGVQGHRRGAARVRSVRCADEVRRAVELGAGRRRIRRAATAWASSCSGASSRASRPARRTPRPRLIEKRYVDAGTAAVEAIRRALRHDDERRRRAGAARPAGAADAADAAGRRRVRAAHRLRQRRESPARAFQRPPVGDGGSIRARRRARDRLPGSSSWRACC